MQATTLLVAVATVMVTMCFSSVNTFSKETRPGFKKAHSLEHKKHLADIEQKLEALLEMEEELESELQEAEEVEEAVAEAEAPAVNEDDSEDVDEGDISELGEEVDLAMEQELNTAIKPMIDPCVKIFCSAGRECIISKEGEGICQCMDTCGEETDARRRVCSNMNNTWMSDCELYRQRCVCEEESEGCLNKEYEHLHIDYYGDCRLQPDCEPEELVDFPRRMKEWLFNIFRDMADRQALTPHFLKLEQQAEEDQNLRWTNAIVWQWCTLDGHPKDRAVSRHELFPLRAPLVTLEHCIDDFLGTCDPDDDHIITIKEWSQCLQLSSENNDQLENMCDEIREG